jgi:hypothetical protein
MTTPSKRCLDRPDHCLTILRSKGGPIAYPAEDSAPRPGGPDRSAVLARFARHAAYQPFEEPNFRL